MRSVLLITALVLGVSSAVARLAVAQTLCTEPAMPAPVDGNAASADQMRVAMAEARNFIAQSSVYQDCLMQEVDAAKAQATTSGQPFDGAIEAGARTKVDASKKAQEKVGGEATTAMAAFKNAHPH